MRFFVWSTLWSSYCSCDLQNIAHIQQKSNAENSGRIESQILTENKKPSEEGTGNAEQPNQSKKMFTLCGG